MNTDRLGNYSGELRPPIPRPKFVATRFERTEWRREGIRTSVPVAKGPVSVAEGELPEWSNVLDHLRAHVLEPVGELDLLGDGHSILGDARGAV